MTRDMSALPKRVTRSLMGDTDTEFILRYEIPKIWTQRASSRFGLYWSEELKHGVLHPVPTDEELLSFYDIDDYDTYLSGEAKALRTTRRSLTERMVCRLAYAMDRSAEDIRTFVPARLENGSTVCDVGCGGGEFLTAVARAGHTPVGVDPSDVSVAATRKRGIECYQGKASNLPEGLKGRGFDATTMYHSLEHCRNPLSAVKNLLEITKPGGFCLVEVPNHDSAGFDLYGPAWYHSDVGRHIHFFTAASLTALLGAAGWEVESVSYSYFGRQFRSDWIASCREVHDNTYGPDEPAPVPRPKQAHALPLLLRMLTMPDRKRYDALRVVARAP